MANESTLATAEPAPSAPAPAAAPAAVAPAPAAAAVPPAQAPAAVTNEPAKPAEVQPPAVETPEAKAARETAEAAKAVPEKYEFKPLEGLEFTPEMVAQIAGQAKAKNMTQAQAQQLYDAHATAAKSTLDAVRGMQEQWKSAVAADPVLSIAANQAIAKAGMEAHADPELIALLSDVRLGYGSHPAVMRHFYKLGRPLQEDSIIPAGAGKTPTDMAKQLYPNHK